MSLGRWGVQSVELFFAKHTNSYQLLLLLPPAMCQPCVSPARPCVSHVCVSLAMPCVSHVSAMCQLCVSPASPCVSSARPCVSSARPCVSASARHLSAVTVHGIAQHAQRCPPPTTCRCLLALRAVVTSVIHQHGSPPNRVVW